MLTNRFGLRETIILAVKFLLNSNFNQTDGIPSISVRRSQLEVVAHMGRTEGTKKTVRRSCGVGKPRVPEVSICPGHLGRFKIGPFFKISLKFGLQFVCGLNVNLVLCQKLGFL
ncbi:hypothetical protein V6Z12_A13G150400 [Gossypium hirsutum]